MKKICISVVVNNKYEKYIPYFIYFILKSYPHYSIKIFFTNNLNKKIKNVISKLEILGNIEIIENFFKNFPQQNQELKTFRWLIPAKYFLPYQYVYIGDVDMMICKEDPSLMDQHIDHLQQNNLPYSNCVRPNTKRLSGLHFFNVEEYYKKMNPIIENYTLKLKRRNIGLHNGKVRNEEILYKMIKESEIGLPKDELRIDHNGSGPHHGLHLGLWRRSASLSHAQTKQILQDSYKQHFEYFKKINEDSLFLYIKNNVPLSEFNNMIKYFNKV